MAVTFGEESVSLTGRVFRHIERCILEGEYPSGSALTEHRISQEVGVSRTPVREALFQLEQEGLVRLIPNKGAVVVGISEKDIDDIYTIRVMIEGLASRWAAERITPEELDKLTEIIDLQRFYVERGDTVQGWNLDSTFHSLLYDACRSNPLSNTLKTFHNYVRKARESSFKAFDRARIATDEHEQILNAIRAHDGELAEKLTAQHIVNAKANLIRSLREQK